VNCFTPESTTFFDISIPKGPIPLMNTLELAYFFTASIPIAPMYLLHLSMTEASVALNSYYLRSPYETSISSKFAIPSLMFLTFG